MVLLTLKRHFVAIDSVALQVNKQVYIKLFLNKYIESNLLLFVRVIMRVL